MILDLHPIYDNGTLLAVMINCGVYVGQMTPERAAHSVDTVSKDLVGSSFAKVIENSGAVVHINVYPISHQMADLGFFNRPTTNTRLDVENNELESKK